MKKSGKLFAVCLLTLSIALAAFGCGESEQVTPAPEPDGNVVTTIVDAYDGESRPNFDEEFDYDSGYVPQPPATEFTVTIAESDKVTFKDGSSSKRFDAGEGVTLDMFSVSDEVVADGRTFIGFGLLGNNGEMSGTVDLTGDNAVTFREDVTLVPYFSASAGYTQLTMNRFNTASLVGEFVSHYNAGTATATPGQVVRGGEYAVSGGLMLKDPDPVYAGSSLRFDTSYLGGDSVPAGVYGFEYNFDNSGKTDLHLSVYQVSMGTDYTKGDYLYETKHYRLDITVGAGESVTAYGQYALEANGNALTYVVFENDCPQLSLGVSVAYRAIEDAEEPENPASPTDGLNVSVTLDEDSFLNGFDVENFTETTQRIGHILKVPSGDQIVASTDPETVFEYWMLERADGSEPIRVTSSTRVPACDATLVPYFTPVTEIKLDLPEGIEFTGEFDYTQLEGGVLVAPDVEYVTGATADGRKVAGWYLPEEDNVMVTASTTVSAGEMTLAPYFAAADGATQLTVGSGRNTSYNPDQVPGEFTQHVDVDKTATVSRNYAVMGADDYAVGGGILVNDPSKITAGAAIRFDTRYSDGTAIPDGVYKFEYNLINLGTEPIRMSLYQISASAEYKYNEGTNSKYDYETLRHRIDVDLESGESGTYSANYELTSNDNALTYIVLEEDVSSLRFAMSVSYAATEEPADAANPLNDYTADIAISPDLPEGFSVTEAYVSAQRIGHTITLPTEEQLVNPNGLVIGEWRLTSADGKTTVTVTDDVRVPMDGGTLYPVFAELTEVRFELPEGASLTDDFDTTQPIGWKLVLPTDEQVTGDTGSIIGWYNYETGAAISSGELVTKNMVVAPYYAAGGSGSVLKPCVGADNATVPDYVVKYNQDHTKYDYWYQLDEDGNPLEDSDGDPIMMDTDSVFAASQVYRDHLYGTRVTSSYDFVKDDGFRVKTGASETLVTGSSYKINVTLTNMAKSGTLKFSMWQINSSSWMMEPNLSEKGTKFNGGSEVAIAAGETVELTVTVSGYSNKNLLTMFIFNDVSDGLDLFISMSQTKL